MGKKRPAEYSGGGTVLSNYNTVSAYASTAHLVDVTSITLTKGVWLVIGFMDMNVSNPNNVMAVALTSNSNSFARTTGISGGGVFVEDIVNVASSTTVTLQGYQYPDTVLNGKILRGTIKAYKISD